jgi:membrane protease YdiL (CAAX protease family)
MPVAIAGAPITSSDAWRLLAVGVGAIYGIQIALFMVGVIAVVASAVSDTACIAFFWWYARSRRIGGRGLGFVKVNGLWYVGAVLVGASAWYVNLTIVTVLPLPAPPKETEGLIEESPLVSTLAAIAVLPAFAEEIVFRGVLARALERGKPAWQAVLVSSGAFGLYHLIPQQVVATFLLGCLLAFFTLRSRSIVPAIILHFLNNAVAIVVTRDSVPGATTWMSAHPALMLSLAVTVLLSGVALAVAAPRRPAEEAVA